MQQVQRQSLFLWSCEWKLQHSWLIVAFFFFVPGEEARVQVFGKVYDIPRKQATYGDAGLTYTYSGVKRLACPWTPTLEYIRDAVTKTTGQTFNFVLVNRWDISSKALRLTCLHRWTCSSLLLQVQGWAGSHGGASWWWEGAGSPLSHRLCLSWSGARLHLPTQRHEGKSGPSTDWTREAGARSWQPAPHELPDQHLLVPQPACPQEDFPASHQPHL